MLLSMSYWQINNEQFSSTGRMLLDLGKRIEVSIEQDIPLHV
jgi:hypothetical protein